MSPYAQTILRDLGVAIHVPGIMALCSLPVCLLAGEYFLAPAFAICAIVSLLPGQVLFRIFRSAEAMQIRHAMDTAVLAWIAISAIGTLPFLLASVWLADGTPFADALYLFRDPWNALFEAVSGFTSTGLTVTASPESLPLALVWWRSFMQWIGGVGVIVLMLSVFHPTGHADRLFAAEAREGRILPDVVDTVRTIWWIYLLFTALSVLALKLAGMSWWHALNYGMAAIATGGFGATDNNIGDFGMAPRLIVLVVIVLGAISFSSHYRILTRGRLDVLWKDRENRWLFILLCAGGGLLVWETWWSSDRDDVLTAVFHWASALCTAGFQSVAFDDWSPTARLLLVAGMTIGGVAGSTAGGLKLYRIGVLADGVLARIGRMARQPWRLVEHAALGDDDEARRRRHILEAASVLALIWVAALVLGSVTLAHFAPRQYTYDAVLLETASALGNVGLSAGITNANLAWPGKLTLIVTMLIGRLEIVPVLVLAAGLLPLRRTRR